jgi:hypothetical protein
LLEKYSYINPTFQFYRSFVNRVFIFITAQINYTLPNGDRYEGQSKDGKRHGQGSFYYFADGYNYTGDWVDDMQTGQGVITWPSGDKYEMRGSETVRHHFKNFLFLH